MDLEKMTDSFVSKVNTPQCFNHSGEKQQGS